MVPDLTEHVKAHVIIGGLLLLNWGGGSEGGLIGQICFELFDLGEFDVGNSGNGHEVLETICNRVGHGGNGWITDRQGNGGDVGNTSAESRTNILLSNVQNGWIKDRT